MKRFLAALLALLVAGPSSAQTVRVGVVPNGVPSLSPAAAPLSPIASFSAGVLPTATALPSFPASFSPLVVVSAAATPIPIPAVAAAASPTAVKAVAAVPFWNAAKVQAHGEAVAASATLFDGSGRFSAASENDAVPGKGDSDGLRSSGLSPPTADEIETAYHRARPASPAVQTFGRDFVAAAAETLQKYTFMGGYLLEQLAPRLRMGHPYAVAAKDLADLHDAGDVPGKAFLELIGRWMAHADHAQMTASVTRRKGRQAAAHLTPSPIPGEYWDMAAGMNAIGFMHGELRPGTNYSFFDYSPFVVSYLRTAAQLVGAKNATVVEGDIGKLTKPAKPIAVLRTKNAIHYVPGFAKKLEEMADWIAPGGQLVIQNDPNSGQRALIRTGHGALIRKLLSDGWKFEYGFSGYEGSYSNYALDTMVLTRPTKSSSRPAKEVDFLWKQYAITVSQVDGAENPFGFLFGR